MQSNLKLYFRTTPRPQVFPLLRSNSNFIQGDTKTKKQFANTITGKYGTGNARGTHIRITKKGVKKKDQEIAGCLSGEAHSGGNHSDMDLLVKVHNMQPRSPNRPSLKYSCGGSGHLSREDTAYCLDGGRTNAVEFKDRRIRRLTPVEAERLQGFPDCWTEKGVDVNGNETLISDTQRYKCLGNAVSCPVISAIMEKLLDFLHRK